MPLDATRAALLARLGRGATLTVIGVTGHQVVPDDALPYVVDGVRKTIGECDPPLRVVTSLAAGADQLVAREVLRSGGRLDAIVPAAVYEATFAADDLRSFEELVSCAESVTRLDFPEPSEQAYWKAGQMIVDRCDVLIAVWDGQPARGLGGTADVVRYARQEGKDVRVVWPQGLTR